MNKVAKIAFIHPFYQKTLGLWAVILMIGGVLMEAKQHVLLARFLFKNPVAFWIIPVMFLLFALVHLRIQVELLRRNDYLVFHQLGLFSEKDLSLFWAKIILANFSPILTYFLFLSYFAWEQGAFGLALALWSITMILLGYTFWKIRKTLHHPLREAIYHRPAIRWAFPRFTWILLSLRQHRPVLVLLTKASGLLLLNGFFYSFQSETYDLRWLQFGILCVAYTQLPLIFEKTEKETEQQSWILALPMTLKDKLGYQLGSLILLASPELFFLVWKGAIFGFSTHLALGVLLLSILCTLQVLVYSKNELIRLPHKSATLFFLIFLAIIFGIPWWILALLFSILFFNQERKSFQF
jgi:hypothetical protein